MSTKSFVTRVFIRAVSLWSAIFGFRDTRHLDREPSDRIPGRQPSWDDIFSVGGAHSVYLILTCSVDGISNLKSLKKASLYFIYDFLYTSFLVVGFFVQLYLNATLFVTLSNYFYSIRTSYTRNGRRCLINHSKKRDCSASHSSTKKYPFVGLFDPCSNPI